MESHTKTNDFKLHIIFGEFLRLCKIAYSFSGTIFMLPSTIVGTHMFFRRFKDGYSKVLGEFLKI